MQGLSAPTEGAEIVKEAYDLIVGARQDDYNHPLHDYERTAAIFNSMVGTEMMSAELGVLFMIAMKLSRLMNELANEKDIPDNTRDTIGYLGCLNMIRAARKGK